MPVEEMLSRMSSRELTEWQAFGLLEPFGELRADLRAGILAAVIAETHRDKDKRPEPFVPSDFVPGYEKRDYPLDKIRGWFQSDEEQEEDAELAKAALSQKLLTVFGRFKRQEDAHGGH